MQEFGRDYKIVEGARQFSFGKVANAVSSLEVVESVHQRLDQWLEDAKQISVQITTNKDPSVTPGRILSENSLKSGYLLRRRVNRAAERIFCVLKPSTKLYLFQTPEDVEPREVIDIERLQSCVVERIDEIEESDDYDYDLSYLNGSPAVSTQLDCVRHLFIIHKPTSGKDKPIMTLEFEAASEVDANDWVNAITSDSVRMERDELVKATHMLLEELKRIESRNESLEEFADQRHSAVKEAMLLKSKLSDLNSSVQRSISDLAQAVSTTCIAYALSSLSIAKIVKQGDDLSSELCYLSSSTLSILNWMTNALSSKIDEMNQLTEEKHDIEDELSALKRVSENQLAEIANMREQVSRLSVDLDDYGQVQINRLRQDLTKSERKRKRLADVIRNGNYYTDGSSREPQAEIPQMIWTVDAKEEFRTRLRSDLRSRMSMLNCDDCIGDVSHDLVNLEPKLDLQEKIVEEPIVLPQHSPVRQTESPATKELSTPIHTSLLDGLLQSASIMLTPVEVEVRSYQVTFHRKHLGIKLIKSNHPVTGASFVVVSSVGVPSPATESGPEEGGEECSLVIVGSVLVSCNGKSLRDLTFKQVAAVLISSARPVVLEFEESISKQPRDLSSPIKNWLSRAMPQAPK